MNGEQVGWGHGYNFWISDILTAQDGKVETMNLYNTWISLSEGYTETVTKNSFISKNDFEYAVEREYNSGEIVSLSISSVPMNVREKIQYVGWGIWKEDYFGAYNTENHSKGYFVLGDQPTTVT